jgi:hypothetical protein
LLLDIFDFDASSLISPLPTSSLGSSMSQTPDPISQIWVKFEFFHHFTGFIAPYKGVQSDETLIIPPYQCIGER